MRPSISITNYTSTFAGQIRENNLEVYYHDNLFAGLVESSSSCDLYNYNEIFLNKVAKFVSIESFLEVYEMSELPLVDDWVIPPSFDNR